MQARLSFRTTVGMAICLLVSVAMASAGDRFIEPGPTVISASERELQADPSAGIEHAIILVEETDRDEDLRFDTETTYHLRAKILSNEGRSLADIEIPVLRGDTRLKHWWGRTILPDGTVLELEEAELERQTEIKGRGGEYQSLKAALPGVVPGSVIDYGYVLRDSSYVPFDRISLQRRWLVKSFTYRWKPWRDLQGAYRLLRTDGLDVQTRVERGQIWVEGRNLPPVAEEPLMPPDYLVRAALVLYYLPEGAGYEDYWDIVGKKTEKFISSWTRKKKSIERALNEMDLPEDADLEANLRAAYAWTFKNIKRTGLMSFEEIELATRDQSARKSDRIAQVLDTRAGSAFDLHVFYLTIARALGARAHLVFVANVEHGVWDPELRSIDQFHGTLVAVGEKEAVEDRLVLLDPGSGLPYGQIPWRVSGVPGLLIVDSGGQAIGTGTLHATQNVAVIDVSLAFAEDNERVIRRWSVSEKGQVGLDRHHYLRMLPPDERQESLDWICGLSPGVDVVTAEVHGLEDLSESLVIDCQTESYSDLHDRIGSYLVGLTGPWMQELPHLPDDDRVHPVHFDFPRMELLQLRVQAPDGFDPRDPPEPFEIENAVGKYTLHITATEDGFRVERHLALYPVVVPADRYGEVRSFIEDVRRHDRTWLTFDRTR